MRTPIFIAVAATLAITLSPILMLSIKGGQGYCFFVVAVLALVSLGNAAFRRHAFALWRKYLVFVIGLLALPLVILFQILALGSGYFPSLDPFVRLALAALSFTLLASLDSKHLRWVQWGFVAGACWNGAWAIYMALHPDTWSMPGRLGNSFTNPIPFGDTALLLGFFSVISISRDAGRHLLENVLKIAALLLGGYASYLSGSRGGWIAIPILLLATFSGRAWAGKPRTRVALVGVLVVVLAAFGSMHIVRERVGDVGSDIHQLQHGNHDTSVGLRLELWRASALIYERHPVLGVGRGGLHDALADLADHGEAPREIVNAGAHSEIFSTLSQGGTIGILALLMFYVGVATPFWRARRSSDPETMTAAYLGLALIGSVMMFGLTIDYLTSVMDAGFVGLTAATLLAWIVARQRETAANDLTSQ